MIDGIYVRRADCIQNHKIMSFVITKSPMYPLCTKLVLALLSQHLIQILALIMHHTYVNSQFCVRLLSTINA